MRFRKLQTISAAALVFCLGRALHAQDIAGSWQGTLDSAQKLRVILQIEKATDGVLKGTAYSIDQSPSPIPVTTISFASPTLKFTVDAIHASYEGTLSPDGKTVTGVFTQGKANPLVFER